MCLRGFRNGGTGFRDLRHGNDPQLLRDIFAAAGGTHDDWDEYDRVMASENRVAVFVTPERVYSN